MKKMKRTFISVSLVVISSVFLLVACGKNQQEQAMPITELPVSTVQQGHGLVSREYAASIEGVTDVEIRPQVSGYLQKILVDEGAFVKAGQALFKIDDRLYAEQYNTAKAAVAAAKANLANVKIDLDRRKELVKEKIVSDLQLQQAQASYDAAKAAVAQAEAAAQLAKINYDFCTITAPVSGYLSRINYRLGSLIGPTGVQPITVLSDSHQLNVYFSMSEADFMAFQNQYEGDNIQTKLKNAAPVGLQIADGSVYELKGKIDAVEGQFNPKTGSVSFRAKFDNPKGILRAGNIGKILIEQNYADVMLIPIASTFNIQDKIYVFALDKDSKTVQQPLEVLGKSGTNYMVQSGLTAGTTYVASGFERLQPGMPVKPIAQSTTKEAATTTAKAE